MAERFNAAVLKTVEDASPPRVRISASPPIVVQKALLKARLFCCKHVENTNAELAELWERSSTPSERQILGYFYNIKTAVFRIINFKIFDMT